MGKHSLRGVHRDETDGRWYGLCDECGRSWSADTKQAVRDRYRAAHLNGPSGIPAGAVSDDAVAAYRDERAAAESDRVVRAQALDACATAAANLAEANVVFEEAINHASWVGATNRSIASAARVSHPTVARIVGAR